MTKHTLCRTKIHWIEIPDLEVTWRTVAIIIRVVFLSQYLCILGLSLSSIRYNICCWSWLKKEGREIPKAETELAVTIQSLTLSWVGAESLYKTHTLTKYQADGFLFDKVYISAYSFKIIYCPSFQSARS